jgi:2-dehydropantoate 2-reductase
MVRDDGVRNVVTEIMREVEAVAAKLGITMPISIEQRIAGAGKVGEHKTSMLQDLEAGRSMELEPVVGAVLELGDRLGVAMPHTRPFTRAQKLMDELARKETKQ